MDYYEMIITYCGSSDGGETFSIFDDKTKIFDSADEAKAWLQEQYGKCITTVKRSQMYRGNGIPCGYIYEYENSDISHYPIEKWLQQDWISLEKCHSECAFEEMKYEIPDVKTM